MSEQKDTEQAIKVENDIAVNLSESIAEVKETVEKTIEEVEQQIKETVKDTVEQVSGQVTETVKETIEQAKEEVINIVSNTAEMAVEKIEEVTHKKCAYLSWLLPLLRAFIPKKKSSTLSNKNTTCSECQKKLVKEKEEEPVAKVEVA